MKHRVPGAIATAVLVVALAYLAAGYGYALALMALAFTVSGLVWHRSRRLAAESSLLDHVSAELVGAREIDDVWTRAATALGRFLDATRVVVFCRDERDVYRLWTQYAADGVRRFDAGASLPSSPFEMGSKSSKLCTVVWLGAADGKPVALAVYPADAARAGFVERFAQQVNRIAETVARCRSESRLAEVRSGLLRYAHALASAHESETVLDLAVSAGAPLAGCEKGAVFVESASVGWRTAFEKGFGAELTPAFLSRLLARLDEAVGQRGPLRLDEVAAALVVPMFHGRELMGVLLLGRPGSSPVWDDADLEGARILGQLTATALKNARQAEALSTVIAGYGEISNLSFDLHVTLDETGTIRGCNAQASRVFGASPLDLVGRRFEDLVDRDFVHRWRQLQRELFRKGSLCQVSTKLRTDDENDIEVVLNAFAQSPDEARLVMSDVTELRRLENQLRHSQRQELLGLLASGVAHDLNNVLGGVLGYASLARHQTRDPRVTKYVETIERTAMRGASLTGRLLSSSRKSSPRSEPVSLNQLIDETLELLAHSMPKNVRIETSLDPSVRVIMADSAQLQQILLNLAINARDAMREGGVLRLSTRLETVEARVRISVQDTGVGMDSKVLERLYEPFFSTKGPKGTGLGLSVVYGIVKSLSGVIRVHSSPGRGTRFDVFLPCRWADEATAAHDVDEPVGHGELILLVDDEEVLRDLGRDILETHGYRVHVVSSGEEAVDFIRRSKESVALVVLDLVMPGIDGGETYRRLRHLDAGLPVLLSSGLTAEQSVEEILTDRATGFLEKPYGQSELARAVRSTILRKGGSTVVH